MTVNVALSDDAGHEGGRLHTLLGGAQQVIERREGEATVHRDDIMHAVSAMRSGVRYSLIMFFYFLLIPAYDFGPVGGGVTFLPKGKRGRGHVPGPKLHDSPDS